MKYYCPVCAYSDLTFPPQDHNICPCCGTEFGYDDNSKSWDDLRQEWIDSGARWFSDSTSKPDDWNAYEQLYGRSNFLTTATNSFEDSLTTDFTPDIYYVEDVNA